MTLTREEKAAQVDAVRQSFANATATVLVDFRGVNVEMITNLRARFRDAGVEYKVVKNNVVRKAIEGSDLADNEEFTANLVGPTA
ncbi:MAG: 50S ribosomal protein L10, partial [Myxococcales bacterium]